MKMIAKPVLLCAIILLVLFGLYQLINARNFQIVGSIINQSDTTENFVALTFDDGPTAAVYEILKPLKEASISATFYIIGEDAQKHRDFIKALLENGHELGNHSYTHKRMVFKSKAFIKAEIDSTNQLINDLGQSQLPTFRPPYGKKFITLPLYLNSINQTTVMWNIDPMTSLDKNATPEEIADFVIQNTRPGSIILLHPWYENITSINHRQSIPLIVKQLQDKQYRFITVSKLTSKL